MINQELLKESAKAGEYCVSTGGIGGPTTSMIELIDAGYWVKVREENQWTAPFAVYAITPAGLAYLYQDAPMVDQPQPTPEVEPLKVGDTVEYPGLDGKREVGTIVEIVTHSMYGAIKIVTSGGNVVDRHAKDIRKVVK